jgi:hypothetical protein
MTLSSPFLLYVCIGIAAGILSGLFGIGGGLVIVPAHAVRRIFTAVGQRHLSCGFNCARGTGGCGQLLSKRQCEHQSGAYNSGFTFYRRGGVVVFCPEDKSLCLAFRIRHCNDYDRLLRYIQRRPPPVSEEICHEKVFLHDCCVVRLAVFSVFIIRNALRDGQTVAPAASGPPGHALLRLSAHKKQRRQALFLQENKDFVVGFFGGIRTEACACEKGNRFIYRAGFLCAE